MKRICVVLSCMLLLIFLAMPVSANSYDALYEAIIISTETGEPLDVTQYRMDFEELLSVYRKLYHKGLLPWYADTYFDRIAAPDGTVSTMIPRDLRDRAFEEERYERFLVELIAETCKEGMSPLQKVLSVHDYIVARTSYSYQDAYNNGYHALVKNQTACYGYAQLFLRIMNKVGIPCQIVICEDVGNGMGHAWNVVQLDGSWYHLDLTWDDPLPDAYGSVLRTHFLKTDKEFKSAENGHTFAWQSDVRCNGEPFDGQVFWADAVGPVVFSDEGTAFLRRNTDNLVQIYAQDLQSGEETMIYSLEQSAVAIGDEYYDCPSEGLCFWNDKLWFNTADTVYSMDADGQNVTVEYTYDTVHQEGGLYSFWVKDGTLTLCTINLDGELRELQEELSEEQYHIHSYNDSHTEPTCTEAGGTNHTCSCGVTYITDRIPPSGHVMVEKVSDSETVYGCENCDYLLPAENIPPVTLSVLHRGVRVLFAVWILAVIGVGVFFVFRRIRKQH